MCSYPYYLVKRVLSTIQMPKSETWDIKIYVYQALFKGEKYYLLELNIHIIRKLNEFYTVGEQIASLCFFNVTIKGIHQNHQITMIYNHQIPFDY